MIGVKIEGRLGNQLFQYAFIYNAAKKLNTRFYIDKSVNDFMLPKYFNIKSEYLYPADRSIKVFRKTFGANLSGAFYRFLKKTFRLKEITIDNNLHPAIELKNWKTMFFIMDIFNQKIILLRQKAI